MTRNKVKLDHAGMRNIASSEEMRSLCRKAAERMAAHVKAEGIRVGDRDGGRHEYELPVKVEDGVYDGRAFADLILNHPSGAAVQAKHGVLTRAASAEGLVVKGGGGSSRRLVSYTSRSGATSTITLAQALNYGGSYTEL